MGTQHNADFVLPTAANVPWVAPVADDFTATWWAACKAKQLLVRRCNNCAHVFFPPRPLCPACWSDDVDWLEVSGRGVIYSYSVVRENDLAPFSTALPYVVAVVELTEGPRLMTTIISSPSSGLAVGAAVEVEFVDRDEWTFPAFRLR